MRSVLTSLSLAAVATAVLGAAPVAAGTLDKKFYPGTVCSADTSEVDRQWGRIFNISSSTRHVFECPLIKDDKNIWAANTYVIDASTVDNVGCDFQAITYLHSNPMVGRLVSARTTSGYSSEPMKLEFSMYGEYANHYYFMSCGVPARNNGQQSGIVSVYVVEES
jgi:hypothetical protein